MSKKTLRLWSVLLSVFLIVSMVPTMVFAGSEDQVEIVTQPENITAQAGEEKTLSVVAENATSYQWQRSTDGENWSGISATNSNYTGAKTDAMTVKVSKTTAGYKYRCVAKNSAYSVPTDVVTITLAQQLAITAQPSDISGESGEEKTFIVNATDATSYQWQRSSDGETWSSIGATNSNYTGAKTNEMTVKISKTTAGFVYRCVVKNGESSLTTKVVSVKLIQRVKIKTQPQDISAPAGEEKTFSVVASNATSYQWQRSSDEVNWSGISATNANYTGVKTDKMTVKVSKTTAGFTYRCIVKNDDSSEISNVVKVTVAEAVPDVEIKEEPQSITGRVGATMRIVVVADNATSYQWQRSSDGETWSNISTTNSNYTGVKTNTLAVTISKTTAGFVYRCVVKNSASSKTTNVVSVNISQTLTITEQPDEVISGKAGEEKTVSVAATSATSYQWQRSSDGENWSGISATNANYTGVKTNEMTVKISKTTAGFVYRCIVKNDAGDSVISNTVAVEIKATVTITFNANGGLIEGYPIRTESAEANSYIFNDTMIAPTRDGFTFTGWCLDPDCQTYMGFSYFVTEDLTLYAAWEEKAGCTVTIDANGGYFNDDSAQTTISFNAEADETIFLTHNFASKIKKDGCAIEGWYLDSACTMRIDILEFTPQRDVTIYARWWEAVNISWDGNGGNICIPIGENTSSYYSSYTTSVLKNGYVDYPFAERDGYVLDGWYFDADCTSEVDFDEFFPKQDWTLYAKWSESVNITWNGNGGIVLGENDSPMYTTAYAKGRILEYPAWAERQGYYFDGWYFDEDCTVRLDYETYIPTADVTFFAKWGTGHIVTWNANGGHFWSGGTTRVDVESGETTIGYYEPQRTGYVFAGWCFDADCTEMVNFDTFFPTEDVTLYAKWVRGATITWDGNGGYVYTGSYCSLWEETVPKGVLYGSCSAKREGYSFDGWYLDPDCTESVEPWEYIVTGDVTFYAGWTDGVTVIWNGNGGYISGNRNQFIVTETVTKDQAINHYNSADRDEYAFDGWYLDPECTISVDPYDYVASENVTFYAGWTDAIYITLDANGGCFWGDSDFTSITNKMPKGQYVGNYLNTPALDGYVFCGWYLDEDCTDGIDVWEYYPETDVTLYAKWAVACTVIWDANGGCFWNDPDYLTYTDSVEKDRVIGYSRDAKKPGFVLVGWCLDAAGEECIDVDEYVVSEDVTFYAKWEKAISVTWNANGGYIWGNEDYPTYMEYVRKNQAIGYRQTVSKDGYAFDGWYLDEDCTESVDPQYYAPSGDVIFYAKWVEAVYVTWNAKGGYIWGDEDHPTYTEPVAKNRRIGYTQSIEREGFDFVGWYLDVDCTESVDPEDYVPETDVTFYAKWREIKDVTVTFDANGGIYRSSSKVSYTLGYDRYVSELFEEDERFYQTVLRDGYYFEDWYLDADCTESVDVWDYRATEDVTFYAKWVEAVHVTWNANGGYFSLDGGGTSTTMTENVRPGYPIGEYPVPEREGYSFDGWYLDAYYSESVDTWWYDVYEDVTLYAKWADNVNVTLDANGGYFGGDPESTTIRTSAKQYSYFVVGDYNTPEREGYVFVGWYLEPDFMTRVYYEYYICEETTLYAKWAEAVYITWNGNGGYYLGDTSAPTYTTPAAKGEPLYSAGYTFLRENYILDDWCLDANCTESVDIYEYVPSQNVTFYAKWVEAVTVTWDANGGYFWPEASDPVSTQMAMVGKGRSVNEYLTPHRTDYEFVGWYLDADCTEEVDVWNYPVNQDVTFYAKWVEPVYATVTWDANGGYYWWNEYAQIYEEYVLVNNTPNSVSVYRPGYSFVGWCLDEECTETVDWWNYTVTGDVTFYAKWAETAVVTWNGNGGYIFGDSYYPEYVELCSKDDAIGHVVSVERENYILDGWYLDADCTESVDPQTYVPTTDVEFFAKWIPIND